MIGLASTIGILVGSVPAGAVGITLIDPVQPQAVIADDQQNTPPAEAPPAPSDHQQVPADQATPPAAAPVVPAEQQVSSPVNGQDIVVTAHPAAPPGDPLQAINQQTFAITQSVDKAFVAPVAMTYKRVLPRPIRSGVRNVLGNLTEPVVFLNFLLQHKAGKAAETFGRFAINSTLGLAGLFDVAKSRDFNLPRRPNGFADTMGFYGVKTGAYFYLPLLGSTTVRDFVGYVADRLVVPLSVGKPFNELIYAIPASTLHAIDYRVEFDDQLRELRENTANPYAASREYYLQSRQAEIDALHSKRHKAAPTIPNPE